MNKVSSDLASTLVDYYHKLDAGLLEGKPVVFIRFSAKPGQNLHKAILNESLMSLWREKDLALAESTSNCKRIDGCKRLRAKRTKQRGYDPTYKDCGHIMPVTFFEYCHKSSS